MAQQAGEEAAVRPFRVDVPEAALVELRRRIAATQWPEKETVADQSQGLQLATMQKLARYWATDYDWRKGEERLNALPQFMTEIDGVAPTSTAITTRIAPTRNGDPPSPKIGSRGT
jgi:Epoxide hydrolase N terminus